MAVDTLGHLLALHVSAAHEQERAQVERLVVQVQDVTSDAVEVAIVDQDYTGDQPAQDAAAHGIQLRVVKLPTAKKGFVQLPRRWVVERSFGWAANTCRPSRDYERFPETQASLHFLVFAIQLLKRFVELVLPST